MPTEIGSYTHIGMVRSQNEDYYSVGENFVVVADGMGGHKKGEVASKTAVESIEKVLKAYNGDEYELTLKEAITKANKEVYDLSKSSIELEGMGTTVVACAWNKKTIYIANVGDSRCYLIRKKEISQISIDHSYVQQLVMQGKITSVEAKQRKDKNLILRAVGCEFDIESDIFEIDRKKGDIIVLCSDGLSNMVEDNTIKDTLIEKGIMQDKVKKLVDIANKNGGPDNITVVVVKFID